MWLLLTALLAICSASEHVSVHFRLHPHSRLNVSSIPVEVLFVGEFGSSEKLIASAQNNGNNTFVGQFVLKPLKMSNSSRTVKLLILENSFLQNYIEMKLKQEGTTHLKMTTENYRIHITGNIDSYSKITLQSTSSNGCGCITKCCSCCETLSIPRLEFEHTICTNISYNAEVIGIDVSIGIDGYYYTQEISARNPPPICFDIPGVEEIADICLAFKKLDVTKKHLAGCVEIEIELIHLQIAHIHLGCFVMPI